MYNTGPTFDDILFIIIAALISIAILYFVIRYAVKHGTFDALHEYDETKKRMENRENDGTE